MVAFKKMLCTYFWRTSGYFLKLELVHFYPTLNWMVIQFVDYENGCKNDCFGVIKEILLKYAFILYRYLEEKEKYIFFQLLKIKNLSLKSFKLTSTKYPCIC